MALLINLLPWMPGHSGFGSYVQRVVPALPGWRLQLAASGSATLLEP
ncbi:MAG: capsule biosynthesis protein CapM, partial [Synechococcaceae bacterium WB9_2_112]|nr:capsule biosynthesis protein CapM [Synechococcaceae bacterium WB9_2_112]